MRLTRQSTPVEVAVVALADGASLAWKSPPLPTASSVAPLEDVFPEMCSVIRRSPPRYTNEDVNGIRSPHALGVGDTAPPGYAPAATNSDPLRTVTWSVSALLANVVESDPGALSDEAIRMSNCEKLSDEPGYDPLPSASSRHVIPVSSLPTGIDDSAALPI